MSERNINRLLFETIDNIRKLASPKINMWGIDDKYAHPPYLRIRFKDTSAEDKIYKKLQDIITRFKGNLEWEMIHNESMSANFIILPKIFTSFVFKEDFKFTKQSLLSCMSIDLYESTIDKAISDVPKLADFIGEHFKDH